MSDASETGTGFLALFRRLQTVQNATARLITGVQRKDHITPILQQLHWLPVRERVIFKHALLVFKALHGLLPPYLADDCQLLADTGRRQLRSSDVATCSDLRTHSSLGDRCFAVAGPRTWNSLPINQTSALNNLGGYLRRICLAKDYGA